MKDQIVNISKTNNTSNVIADIYHKYEDGINTFWIKNVKRDHWTRVSKKSINDSWKAV